MRSSARVALSVVSIRHVQATGQLLILSRVSAIQYVVIVHSSALCGALADVLLSAHERW